MTLIAVSFSKDNPGNYPSLAPTFLAFYDMVAGTTLTPPGITQLAATGVYWFLYGATTPTYFLLDGVTVSTSTDRYVFGVLDPVQQVDLQLTRLSSTLSAYNSTLNALGNSNVALGTTNFALGTTNFALNTTIFGLGTTSIALGTTSVAIGTTILAGFAYGDSLLTDISSRIGTTASSFGTTATDPGDLYGHLKRAQEFREGNQTFSKTSGVWAISTRGGTLLIDKTLSQTSTNVTKS